jgi:hypothetical protein
LESSNACYGLDEYKKVSETVFNGESNNESVWKDVHLPLDEICAACKTNEREEFDEESKQSCFFSEILKLLSHTIGTSNGEV